MSPCRKYWFLPNQKLFSVRIKSFTSKTKISGTNQKVSSSQTSGCIEEAPFGEHRRGDTQEQNLQALQLSVRITRAGKKKNSGRPSRVPSSSEQNSDASSCRPPSFLTTILGEPTIISRHHTTIVKSVSNAS